MKKDYSAKQLLVRAKTSAKKQVKKQEKRQNKRLVKRQAKQLVGVTGNPAPKSPETPAPEVAK
jgi:hypothetical protein